MSKRERNRQIIDRAGGVKERWIDYEKKKIR